MWLIAVALVVILLFVMLIKTAGKGGTVDEARHEKTECGSCLSCNGTAEKCIHDRILERSVAQPEYFDDEELDEFKGRSSNSYSEKEIEMFAEVLFTMKPEEVKDWLESLALRHIELPDALKDEAFMLMEG